ncbi:MAG: right-handed parallel beta-helix repeat-containing protein, partial [Bacteroidetes bacterium]|nr:right-handed parallel beta-helix repeat-containing protein [Bacteroidota bacterium]
MIFDDVNLAENVSACAGTPNPGNTIANPTIICPNQQSTLSLQNTIAGSGVSYLWQSGPSATGPWTNIAGTFSTNTVTVATTTWYRCQVSCTFSSLSAFSAPVQIIASILPAGTYTIGPSGNFPNFTAAVAALSCGISGPVIFNVITNTGPYTEQISIPQITGASSTNTITFNGNGNTIQFFPTNFDRHIIKLDGADHVTFNNLTVLCTNPSLGYGFLLINDADDNKIENCTIDLTASFNTSSNANAGIAITGSQTNATFVGNSGKNNIITGNTIKGGYFGITINGSFTVNSLNNEISNCTIENFYIYGIYLQRVSNSSIKENILTRPTRAFVGSFYGISHFQNGNNVIIESNRMYNAFGGNTSNTNVSYCIFHSNVTSTVGNENKVINNLIYDINNNGTIYAIYNASSSNLQYLHNTISLDYIATFSNSFTRGFFQNGFAGGIVFRNNIISIGRGGTGTKHCLYFGNTGSQITSNNNILSLNAPSGINNIGFWGNNFLTLPNWKTANAGAFDQNSVDVNPNYSNPATGDFTPSNPLADNIGAPLGITVDILNSPRSTTTPDAGAFEFSFKDLA